MENLVESVTFPDSRASPKDLSPAEKLQLREFERSQQQDDDFRMILESDRHASEAATRRKEETGRDAEEPKEEKHISRGGWMHRSRGSCELLQDRKYRNVGGD